MISVDDIVKLILAISFAFAMVVIAYQISRLIKETTGLVRDTRKPVNNVGSASDLMLEDYKAVRRIGYSLSNYASMFTSMVPERAMREAAHEHSEKEQE